MEVCVRTYVENLDGSRKLINTAYLVMVALDEQEHPVAVPRLRLETAEERADWQAAETRFQLRKQRLEQAANHV